MVEGKMYTLALEGTVVVIDAGQSARLLVVHKANIKTLGEADLQLMIPDIIQVELPGGSGQEIVIEQHHLLVLVIMEVFDGVHLDQLSLLLGNHTEFAIAWTAPAGEAHGVIDTPKLIIWP